MDELTRKLMDAREHVRVDVDDGALDRQWRGLRARRRRRTVTRASLALAALVLGAFGVWRLVPTATNDMAARPDLRLPDGSQVFFVAEGTELTPAAVSDERITLELVRGAARFEVSRRPEREFVVEASGVEVRVVGTVFVVEHEADGRHVRVTVSEGRVRVRGSETRELTAGERGRFERRTATANDEPPLEPSETTPEPTPAVERAAVERAVERAAVERAAVERGAGRPAAERAAAERPAAPRAWRALAEEGEFDAAWDALVAADDVRTTDVGDLLLAADSARLSGHPDQAVGYLRRVIDEHAADSRAPLAAFTLGRVLLRARPLEAAEAFATAGRLDPTSSLAQDALAREVEAWHRAGREERARALAEEYVARFPSGVRVDAVRRFGGLD